MFGDPPADLVDRYNALRATGAEVAKLAIQVSTLEETLPLFDLAAKQTSRAGHVLIAMGNQGLPTRVLAARLRNRWTYAGDGIAPGQLPASRLHQATSGFAGSPQMPRSTRSSGIPIIHSRSPVMHNAGFAALGLNAVVPAARGA